jgi:hypothetical protein
MYGRGKVTYQNGQVYRGEFKDGQENGLGLAVYPGGLVYFGEWKDGTRGLLQNFIRPNNKEY